jgi:putative endonuclease
MSRERNDQRKVTGKIGEDLAAAQLESQGYRIVARNWRCRTGELDIVAEHHQTLVFVEVRSRKTSGRFGSAKESIDYRKQKKVRDTAQVYLYQHRQHQSPVRFDVMSVELNANHVLIRIEHIVSAF